MGTRARARDGPASYRRRMPFRAAPRPPDLERVARVLEGGRAGGWVPSAPAPTSVPGSRSRQDPGDGSLLRTVEGPVAGPVAAAVRRLTERATEDDEVARLDADLRRARRPAVLTVPDELRAGRRGVSSAAVVSLLALVVAVGCAFVLRVLWAERSSSAPGSAPGPSRGVQVEGMSAAPARVPVTGAVTGGRSSSSAGAPTAGAEVVVHVVGQVVRPGLVRLRQGARVADAIAAAGGTRTGADVSVLNLARLVVDGEQVWVGRRGEPAPGGAGSRGSGGSVGTGTTSAGSSPSGSAVSLNAADVATLDTLPGVGPVLAQRIIDWRTEHGRFTSVDELGEVSGIGDKLMAQLRARVTL